MGDAQTFGVKSRFRPAGQICVGQADIPSDLCCCKADLALSFKSIAEHDGIAHRRGGQIQSSAFRVSEAAAAAYQLTVDFRSDQPDLTFRCKAICEKNIASP